MYPVAVSRYQFLNGLVVLTMKICVVDYGTSTLADHCFPEVIKARKLISAPSIGTTFLDLFQILLGATDGTVVLQRLVGDHVQDVWQPVFALALDVSPAGTLVKITSNPIRIVVSIVPFHTNKVAEVTNPLFLN